MAYRGLKKIFATALTDVRASTEKVDDLGDIRFENGKIYKYCQYKEGTGTLDITSGDFLVYWGTTGHAAFQVTADYSDAAETTAPIPAGVATAAVTTDAQYFWLQIKGPATLTVTLGGTATDGSNLIAKGAADKALDMLTTTTAAIVCAFAEDASAKKVILDCPF